MPDAPSIFLSYASQDAATAARLGEALRAHGLSVWFDQSELRGGDAWDQLIRRRIRECALFVPVISANTQTRLEGYFRLEWRLAVERTHLMADGRAFLVPVVIDAIDEAHAQVPEAFRTVQWTRLAGGMPTPAFLKRIHQLLDAPAAEATGIAAGNAAGHSGLPARTAAKGAAPAWRRLGVPVAGLLGALAAVVLLAQHFGKHPDAPSATLPAPAAPAAPASPAAGEAGPPTHSVAVLPFTNMSGDPKDDYFSDGLSEELLNTLASVRGLQVAARTSSFSFKGKDVPVAEIARKLNVAAVLEGSVRRDKSHVRISTELIDAKSGFQHWSQTYDRDLKDVLGLQSEIAKAVAAALKVQLLSPKVTALEIGGTDNPRAFDAFLRAAALERDASSGKDIGNAERDYSTAIALDPGYANAYVGRAGVRVGEAIYSANSPAEIRRLLELAVGDARKALELAPALGSAYAVLGSALSAQQDYIGAAAAYRKAQALSPGDGRDLRASAAFFGDIGGTTDAIALGRRAVEIDPLNPRSHGTLGTVYYNDRRYADSIAAFQRALALAPNLAAVHGAIGSTYIMMGNYRDAKAACDAGAPDWPTFTCLAIVEDKLGRHEAATAALARLLKEYGDSALFQLALIYAQWGDLPRALDTLERAVTTGDPGVENIRTEPLLDPLRGEPRFKAAVARLKFPD